MPTDHSPGPQEAQEAFSAIAGDHPDTAVLRDALPNVAAAAPGEWGMDPQIGDLWCEMPTGYWFVARTADDEWHAYRTVMGTEEGHTVLRSDPYADINAFAAEVAKVAAEWWG